MRTIGWGLSVVLLFFLIVGSGGAQASAPSGGIFVADTGNNRLVRIDDMTGAGWTTLGGPVAGQGTDQFKEPWMVFVDTVGRIYVGGDPLNDRIVRVNDMTGTGWTTFGARGSGVNQFGKPLGVFVDGAGRIYVTEALNNRIVRVNDLTGAGWITFGAEGSGTNQFSRSTEIFVDAAGKIYVADSGNNRIVRMNDMTGAGWTSLGSPGNGKNQFNSPRGIFVR